MRISDWSSDVCSSDLADIAAAYKLTSKSARSDALNAARAKAKEAFASEDPQMQMVAIKQVKKLEAEIVRSAILKDGQRIDGRNTKQISPIEAIVGFLPRTDRKSVVKGKSHAVKVDLGVARIIQKTKKK